MVQATAERTQLCDNAKKIKVAVQFFGHLRTFEKCQASIKRNLLDLYDCDVFMHTWAETDHSTQTYYKPTAKIHQVDQGVIAGLQAVYGLKDLQVEHQKIREQDFLTYQCNSQKAKVSTFGLSCMYASQYKVNELRKKYQQKHHVHYDYVVAIRPDVYLKKPFILSLLDRELKITEMSGENVKFAASGRYLKNFALVTDNMSDILYVARPHTMDEICKILHQINFQDYKSSFWNPENMATYELFKNGIATFPMSYRELDEWGVRRKKNVLKNLLKFKFGKDGYLKILPLLPHLLSVRARVGRTTFLLSLGE